MTPPPGSGEAGDGRLRALAIVPARLGSTRLPRKMLLRETGRYLFEHTVNNAARSATVGRVVLATDSDEILDAARDVGIEALATSGAHPSGTDRVNEALELLLARGDGPYDVVVNVQGDEPDLPTDDLDALVAAFEDPAVEAATLAAPVADEREARDPAVVKVVVDDAGDALYFSRSTVPALDHPDSTGGLGAVRRHVGVYAYRPDALAAFCALPPGRLERIEHLEQLRWLEAGRRMRVLAASRVPAGIDTAEHYAAFVAREALDPTDRVTPTSP